MRKLMLALCLALPISACSLSDGKFDYNDPADRVALINDAEVAVSAAEGLVATATAAGWIGPDITAKAQLAVLSAKGAVAHARAAEASGGSGTAYALEAFRLAAELTLMVQEPAAEAAPPANA